tara:strand:- start:2740 stop:3930 length:1191 start_codon:yes stop_codon:yes gene_type:complete
MTTLTNEALDDLRKKVDEFDFEKKQKTYAERLEELSPPSRNYNLFDLATDLSRGLSAQMQSDRPDSLAGGLALGFGEASANMRAKQENRAKLKREIGLQASKLALEDERAAIKYLDDAEYELAVAESGVGKTTADMTNFNFYNSLDEDGKKTWNTMKNQDPTQLLLLETIKRQAASAGGLDLLPGQIEIDKAFGKAIADYKLQGQAQVISNLRNLSEKIKILDGTIKNEKGQRYNVSGPLIGVLDDAALAVAYPDAAGFRSDIRDIVFQSLREKLGAQFTEKEGERLVNAAFNFYLEEEQNIGRLKRLYKTIEDAANAKNEAIAYFDEKGTLQGFSLKAPVNFDDIHASVVQESDFDNISDEDLAAIIRDPRTEIKERQIAIEVARRRVKERQTEE